MVGRYEKIEMVGKGGEGSIWKVKDLLAGGRVVAMKCFESLDEDGLNREESFREFRLLSQISHPRLSKVFDFGWEEVRAGTKVPYYTREFIDGMPLSEIVSSGDLRKSLELLVEILRGLKPLHRAGIIHGDLKPSNVIIDGAGLAHLIDFSMVKLNEPLYEKLAEKRKVEVVSTMAGDGGTILYMAPEVLKGGAVDQRADLYSAGIIFCELFLGFNPLKRFSTGSVDAIRAHLDGKPFGVFMASSGGKVPDEVVRLVKMLLSVEVDERASAVEEIESFINKIPGVEVSADPWEGREVFIPANFFIDKVGRVVEFIDGFFSKNAGEAVCSCLITGGEGSGKSAILQNLKWRFQLQGYRVIEAYPKNYTSSEDFLKSVFLQIEWLHTHSEDKDFREGGKVEEAFPHKLLHRLRAISRSEKIVFIVDDCEYLPAEFIKAVARIVDEWRGSGRYGSFPRMAFVSGAGVEKGRVFDSISFELKKVFKIKSLRRGDIEDILLSMVGRVAPEAVDWVMEVSGGNFSLAIEAARCLASENYRKELSGFSAEWLNRVVRDRIDKSDECSRRVVFASAISVDNVSIEDVVGVLNLDGYRITARDVDGNYIQSATGGLVFIDNFGFIRFHSGYVRKVVAALLDEVARRRLNLRWAEFLQKEGREKFSWIVHSIRGGKVVDVFDVAMEESRKLIDLGRCNEGVAIASEVMDACCGLVEKKERAALLVAQGCMVAGRFSDCLDIVEGIGGKNDCRKEYMRGFAIGRMGRIEEGIEILEKLVLKRGIDPELRDRIFSSLCDLYMRCGEQDRLLSMINEEIGGRANGQMDVFVASLMLTRGMVYLYRGMLKKAERDFFTVFEKSKGGDLPFYIHARALGCIAVFEQNAGRLDSAIHYYRKAASICRQYGHTGLMAQTYLNQATSSHRAGRFEEAVSSYLMAKHYALLSGNVEVLCSASINYGLLLGFFGRVEEAEYEVQKGQEEATKFNHRIMVGRAEAALGEICIRRGTFEEAEVHFREAEMTLGEVGGQWERVEISLEVVDCLLLKWIFRGDTFSSEELEEIRRRLSEVEKSVSEGKVGGAVAVRLYICMAENEMVLSNWDRARSWMEKAGEYLQEVTSEFEVLSWKKEFIYGLIEMRAGEDSSAVTHLSRARQEYERLISAIPARFRSSFELSYERKKFRSILDEFSSRKKVEGVYLKLLEINRRIARSRDIKLLVELIIDSALEVTGTERGFLLLEDDRGQASICTARQFERRRIPQEHINFSTSVARKVFEGGEAIFTVSAMDDERFANAESVHQLGLQSIICIPIRKEDRTIGVIYLENRSAKALLISPEEKHLLFAFADQVAIAVETARLFEENRRKMEQIQKLTIEKDRLLEKNSKALREARAALKSYTELFSEKNIFRGMIGASPSMKRIFETIKRLDETDVPVLIYGESGTGKELVARAIHSGSRRGGKNFYAINCGALPEGLLESELFGHVKGAFTGATHPKRGIFKEAFGSSLLLDEISNMGERMQVALLRVLQEGKIRPVGSDREEDVDVRILSATQIPLENLVRKSIFRRDLYYRLNVVSIKIPPLRERKEDIPLLIDYFLSLFAVQMNIPQKVVSRRALKILMDYPWYGNVRELQNTLLGVCVLEDSRLLDADNFEYLFDRMITGKEPTPRIGLQQKQLAGEPSGERKKFEEEERRKIIEALRRCGWNKTEAARLLSIPRRSFYRKLKKYSIIP